jgi:hypothetical protein
MTTKSAYDALLKEVCVGLGFCGSVVDGKPLHVDHFIPDQGAVSANQFVDWLFRAEGMDPWGADAREHRESLRQAFVRHMGGDAVDAQMLK